MYDILQRHCSLYTPLVCNFIYRSIFTPLTLIALKQRPPYSALIEGTVVHRSQIEYVLCSLFEFESWKMVWSLQQKTFLHAELF